MYVDIVISNIFNLNKKKSFISFFLFVGCEYCTAIKISLNWEKLLNKMLLKGDCLTINEIIVH